MMPPPRPMRKPVNMVTRVVVEPTEPRAVAPTNCPTTAKSARLKSTWRRFEQMRGRLKVRICLARGPRVMSWPERDDMEKASFTDFRPGDYTIEVEKAQ